MITTLKLAVPCLAALFSVQAYAATITETTSDNGASGTGSGVNSDYNAALYGTPASVPTASNNYVTAAGLGGSGADYGANYTTRIRINDSGTTTGAINTFQGNSLELVSGVEVLDKSAPGDGASANLILDNGSIFTVAANTAGTTSLGGSLQVSSGTGAAILGVNQTGAATLNINSSLTGTGTLDLFGFEGSTAATIDLNGNINSFGGTLNLSSAGTYGITTTAIANGATLDVSATTATFDLSNNLVLGGLMDGTNTFGPGVYTAAELNAVDGNSDFVDSTGLDTITVAAAPEPQTWALLGAGLGGVVFLLRRRLAD